MSGARAGGGIPRVALLHDLTGVGRCAMTVAAPALTRMGVEVCPVPTALLSTHPAGFGPFHFRPLTSDLEAMLAHYRREGLAFEGCYLGFVAEPAQVEVVAPFLAGQAGAMTLLDPVMGDGGQLYRFFGEEIVPALRAAMGLVRLATPNLTEACLLLGLPYEPGPLSEARAVDLAQGLLGLGPEMAVVTSVPVAGRGPVNVAAVAGRAELVGYEALSPSPHGAGDLFAALLLARLIRGEGFFPAVGRATAAATAAVRATLAAGTPAREGLLIEGMAPPWPEGPGEGAAG